MVTIKDVAREAGVAISTVSNVLNKVDVVTDSTKKKVLDAVEKLGYVPNMSAKSLKNSKSHTIGLFLRSIQGDYYKLLMQAIHWECKMRNYLLNIYVSNVNTSEEVYGMIISSCVEGAIVLNESLKPEHLERLEEAGLPIVFFDRSYSSQNISSITIDDRAGTKQAMEHLIQTGHKRIGFIQGADSRDNTLRFETYEKVMEQHHLPIDRKLIGYGEFGKEDAYKETLRILAEADSLPDALFCANDDMAFGSIAALQESGISVPGQVSVVGYDDSVMAQYSKPPLTTVHSPIEELGKRGIIELFRLLSKTDSEIGKIEVLHPTLMIRESSMKNEQ